MHPPHLPVLRRGRVYESLDKFNVADHRTGEVRAAISTVNAGIIRSDLQRIGESRAALKKFSIGQLIELRSREKPYLPSVAWFYPESRTAAERNKPPIPFIPDVSLRRYRYTIEGWIGRFATWRGLCTGRL